VTPKNLRKFTEAWIKDGCMRADSVDMLVWFGSSLLAAENRARRTEIRKLETSGSVVNPSRTDTGTARVPYNNHMPDPWEI
jgi:hypothetical protein